MQVNIPGHWQERISTAVMGTVLECHDQGFHLLGAWRRVPTMGTSISICRLVRQIRDWRGSSGTAWELASPAPRCRRRLLRPG